MKIHNRYYFYLTSFLAYVYMCGRDIFNNRHHIYTNMKSIGSKMTKVSNWKESIKTQHFGLTNTFSIIWNFVCFMFSPEAQLSMLFNYSLTTLRYVFVIMSYVRVSLYFYGIYNVLYSSHVNLITFMIGITMIEMYSNISKNDIFDKYMLYSDLVKFMIAVSLNDNKMAIISLIQFGFNLYFDELKKYAKIVLTNKVLSAVKSAAFQQCKHTIHSLQMFLIQEINAPNSFSRTLSYLSNDSLKEKINELVVKINSFGLTEGNESIFASKKLIAKWCTSKLNECVNYSDILIRTIHTEIQYWGLGIVYTLCLVSSYLIWFYTNDIRFFSIDISLRIGLACMMIIKFYMFTESIANTFVYVVDEYSRYMEFCSYLFDYLSDYMDGEKQFTGKVAIDFGLSTYRMGTQLRFW
jgi:hypothetical protein